MSPVSDAWQNRDARALLDTLHDRGIRVTVRAGRLNVWPASKLTHDDVVKLRSHKPALVMLVLACDDRVFDRLLELRRGPRMTTAAPAPGRCHTCRELLSRGRVTGRCGWCALAGRLYAGAPLTPSVLALFDVTIVGQYDETDTAWTLDVQGRQPIAKQIGVPLFSERESGGA